MWAVCFFPDIAEENGIEIDVFTFCYKFVVTSLGSYMVAGGDENFHFCIGEYGGADITAVHDNAFAAPHLLLQGDHGFADEGYDGYGADV